MSIITYSDNVPGERDNHNQAVRFDHSGGCIGINQYDTSDKLTDRILLSRKQIAALVKFIERPKRRKLAA